MSAASGKQAAAAPLISLIVPYYNEEAYLGATLESLAAQSDRGFELLLVDNGSSDGSAKIAAKAKASMKDVAVRLLSEPEPGKIWALRQGVDAANGAIVATLDADTIYPAEYVARIRALMGTGAVASLAFVRPDPASDRAGFLQQLYAELLPRKCHSGGCGQAFRREELLAAGGFDPELWPYVLEDHEIMHRVAKRGRLAYSAEHVCFPSDRRSDRTDCSWTLAERLLYKALPNAAMDWFYYRFLAGRLAERGLTNVKLRGKSWEAPADA